MCKLEQLIATGIVFITLLFSGFKIKKRKTAVYEKSITLFPFQ
jgi:hypothetical protein